MHTQQLNRTPSVPPRTESISTLLASKQMAAARNTVDIPLMAEEMRSILNCADMARRVLSVDGQKSFGDYMSKVGFAIIGEDELTPAIERAKTEATGVQTDPSNLDVMVEFMRTVKNVALSSKQSFSSDGQLLIASYLHETGKALKSDTNLCDDTFIREEAASTLLMSLLKKHQLVQKK